MMNENILTFLTILVWNFSFNLDGRMVISVNVCSSEENQEEGVACFREINSEQFCSATETEITCDKIVNIFRLKKISPLEEVLTFTSSIPKPGDSFWFNVGNIQLRVGRDASVHIL